jgi:hypothetical protein
MDLTLQPSKNKFCSETRHHNMCSLSKMLVFSTCKVEFILGLASFVKISLWSRCGDWCAHMWYLNWIPYKRAFKYLRVIFEKDLFWNKHIHASLRAKERAERLKKIQKRFKKAGLLLEDSKRFKTNISFVKRLSLLLEEYDGQLPVLVLYKGRLKTCFTHWN